MFANGCVLGSQSAIVEELCTDPGVTIGGLNPRNRAPVVLLPTTTCCHRAQSRTNSLRQVLTPFCRSCNPEGESPLSTPENPGACTSSRALRRQSPASIPRRA